MPTAFELPSAVRDALVVTLVVWAVAEARQSLHRRPEAAAADRGSLPAIRLSAAAGIGGAVLAAHLAPGATVSAPWVRGWIGLALVWCGIGLRLWCFRTLGRYFTFTVQTSRDQTVVTVGPYRVIRHPSYAGILLVALGAGLLAGNAWSLVVLVGCLICGVVYRIHVEEQALLANLGDPYRRYAEGHKRLVPYVW